MIQEGLLLGLSTGSFCAISCAPVAIPFIFSEKIDGWRQNARLVGLMLLGRLAASNILIGALMMADGLLIF
jgi:hypothetical protein